MATTIFPIVERESRVASRQPVTYWSRFGAGAGAMGLGFWSLLMSGRASPSEVGANMFGTVAACLFLYIVVAGTLVTCDCVSEEKRDGTLGLLFLTDLKGYDIVFGKLSATSLRILYGVIATFPILAIPILLGGVSYGQFWRVVLTALNLLFFSLATGILASSLCRSGSKAAGLAALIGGGLMALTPFLVMLHVLRKPMLLFSPGLNCFASFDNISRSTPSRYFCINALVTHFYAWAFLIAACRIVPRSWRDEDVTSPRKFRFKLPKFFRKEVWKKSSRSSVAMENPYHWRCTPSPGSRRALWCLLAALLLIIYLLDVSSGAMMGVLLVYLPAIVSLIVKCWASFQSSRQFNEDRRSGGLELLLSTPLSETEIVNGQHRAFRKQFLPIIVFVLFIITVHWLSMSKLKWTERNEVAFFYAVIGFTLITDLWALSWVGLWTGLIARTSNRAATGAMIRILIVPSVVAVFILGAVESSSRFHSAYSVFTIWGFVSLLFGIAFSEVARNKLATEFRSRVAQQGAGVPVAPLDLAEVKNPPSHERKREKQTTN